MNEMPSVLRQLGASAAERAREAERAVPLSVIRERALSRQPLPFALALRRDSPAFIAEVKRASPSEGAIRLGADPAEVAIEYASAGAAALSVLTEPSRFGGSLEALRAVRAAVELPLLLKDFVVDPYQIWQGREAGADAALLIAALLPPPKLAEFLAECQRAEMDALVEVHNAEELEWALGCGAKLIGINNRNLHTLEVSLDVSRSLATQLSRAPDALFISESGISSPEAVLSLKNLGYSAFLVGTYLMKQPSPGTALRMLREACLL